MGFLDILKNTISKTKASYKQGDSNIAKNNNKENIVENKVSINKDSEPKKNSIELKPKVDKQIDICVNYKLPNINEVLNKVELNDDSQDDIKTTTINLQNVLNDFGLRGKVVSFHKGPFATLYDMAFEKGTKVSAINSLTTEIAIGLGVSKVEIEPPKDGKITLGVLVYNKEVTPVPLREIMDNKYNDMLSMKLPMALGKDTIGNDVVIDLETLPHLLISGQTGSGKSVFIHSLLSSLLICKRPDEVKLIIIDPKRIEYGEYNGVPHLYYPVITDVKQASVALQSAVRELDNRYKLFESNKAKSIEDYNRIIDEEKKKKPDDYTLHKVPYIVIVIDELSDLMMIDRDNVQDSILRLTEMGRLVGIHLVVATQRPSTDVLTGSIKANIHNRIAFTVASKIDSRTIIDENGAEELLGKGDMIYRTIGKNNMIRVQSCYVTDEEIDKINKSITCQLPPQYEIISLYDDEKNTSIDGLKKASDDPLYNECLEYAVRAGSISASKLQRQFGIGFNRACKIIDEFEADGIVGPQKGSKPREVLIKMEGVTPNSEE